MTNQVQNNRPIQPRDTHRTGKSSRDILVHPDEHHDEHHDEHRLDADGGPPDPGPQDAAQDAAGGDQDKPVVPPHERHDERHASG